MMMMSDKYKLPDGFVEKYLAKAKRCTMFGVPIEELSREELIAACLCGWEMHSKALEEHDRQEKFLQDTEKVRPKSMFETFFGVL
jgi:hypothetical protein